MNNFEIKTRIKFGEGSLKALQELKNKNVLIITDPFMVKSKTIDKITSNLINSTYQVFEEIVPDPPIEVVVAGIEAFKSINDFINEINTSGENKSGINYEKDLISSNIDNFELSDEDKAILEFIIYPSKNEKKLHIDDAFSIFIGYEIDISEETKKCTSSDFIDEVKKKILLELDSFENKVYKKINDNNLLGHTFFVYIVPFTDIDNTRRKILEDILT